MSRLYYKITRQPCCAQICVSISPGFPHAVLLYRLPRATFDHSFVALATAFVDEVADDDDDDDDDDNDTSSQASSRWSSASSFHGGDGYSESARRDSAASEDSRGYGESSITRGDAANSEERPDSSTSPRGNAHKIRRERNGETPADSSGPEMELAVTSPGEQVDDMGVERRSSRDGKKECRGDAKNVHELSWRRQNAEGDRGLLVVQGEAPYQEEQLCMRAQAKRRR